MNTFGVLSEVNGRICSLITAALSRCRNFRQLAVVELRNRYTVSLPISEAESEQILAGKDQGKDKPHHNHRRNTELLGYVALLE